MTRIKCVILFVAILAGVVRADVRWNLTTADLQTTPVNLLSIDNTSIRYVDPTSAEKTIPLDQFVSLQAMLVTPRPSSAKFMLVLSNGARLSGNVKDLKDEKLTFVSPFVGEVTLPLKQVIRLESASRPGAFRKASASKTEDKLQLANCDTVQGLIETINGSAVTIKTAAGPTDVPLDSIAAVVFADTGQSAVHAASGFRLAFDDGSNVTVPALSVQGSSLSITLETGGTRSIDLDKLVSIEQVGGAVGWLSAFPPAEAEQVPFFSLSWPANMDKSVTGQPIVFGPRTYAHGIGVHSRSRLTWKLDGSYKSFRTQYAIDGNLPYADVDVRVLLDDKVVHEAKGFKASVLSPVVAFDLNDATSITLEVDFGSGDDVQDRLNWIEPALLRAAAPPATQP